MKQTIVINKINQDQYQELTQALAKWQELEAQKTQLLADIANIKITLNDLFEAQNIKTVNLMESNTKVTLTPARINTTPDYQSTYEAFKDDKAYANLEWYKMVKEFDGEAIKAALGENLKYKSTQYQPSLRITPLIKDESN